MSTLDDVFGIRGDECAAVIGPHIGIRYDLLGLEIAQVDDGDAWIRLVVDEQKLPVIVRVGLGQRWMMGVTPGDFVARHTSTGHERLVFFRAVGKALPRLRRKRRYHLEQAHRRHTDYQHLTRVPS